MRTSLNWIKDLVPGLEATPQEFMDAMTLSGSKVEFYECMDKDLEKIVVGQIEKIEKHPDADKLVICQVNVGSETIQIVTGAPNVYEGAKVPVLSTPSARRATTARPIIKPCSVFLSTPSARRATAKTETKSLFSYKLYNILHEFRRALIYNGSKNDPNHAKRLKNPVRRCRKNAENSPFAPGRKTQNNSRPSCSKGG